MKRLVTILFAMVFILGTLVACDSASNGDDPDSGEKITLIYTHYQPGNLDQPKQAAAEAFKGYVEDKTNGKIEVEIYPNSELGDGPAVLEAMQSNTIQMTVVHDGPVSAFYAPMGVFSLPFLFQNHSEAWNIYDGEFTAGLGEDMRQATGIRMLAMADNGVRHLTNSKKTISTMADASGMLIRIQPSPVYTRIIEGIGATPVEVAWAELPAALQQGVADGQENGITNILAANLYETQKYLTLTGHVYSYHAYLISDDFYNSLSSAEQKIIQEATDLAKWIHRGMTAHQDNSIGPVLSQYGVEVTTLSPEAFAEFRDSVQPSVIEWMREQYGDVVDQLVEEVNSLRN